MKLIANKEILETLDKLDKAYENVFNNSYEFIKLMAIPENFRDIDFLIKSMAKVDLDGKAVLDLRDLLMEQMLDFYKKTTSHDFPNELFDLNLKMHHRLCGKE